MPFNLFSSRRSSSRSSRRSPAALLAATLLVCLGVLLAQASPASATLSTDAGALAAANVGKSAGYCAVHPTKNTAGGKQYATSCDGHLGTGKGEYWCADFARWVWGKEGFITSGLTAAAASFDSYGSFHSSPMVGDAITFAYSKGGTAHHVGIVTAVGTEWVTLANGDWNGTSGSGESYFARTSKVVSLKFKVSLAHRGDYVPAYDMYVSRIVAPMLSA